MAVWSPNDLALEALKRMAVLATGQSAAAEDVAELVNSWGSVWKNLRTEQIAPFPQTAIPQEAQSALADVMAHHCMTAFGITGDRAAILATKAEEGRRALRREYEAIDKQISTRARYF